MKKNSAFDQIKPDLFQVTLQKLGTGEGINNESYRRDFELGSFHSLFQVGLRDVMSARYSQPWKDASPEH